MRLAAPTGLAQSTVLSEGGVAARPARGHLAYQALEDGSSYNVALPLESPNDGPRSIVTDPADAALSPHGWHDLDGLSGRDTSITNGNNVHAYADTGDLGVSYAPVSAPEFDNDAPDPDPDAQPDGGPSLRFDAPFSPSDPTALQNRRAAVINLISWNSTITTCWRATASTSGRSTSR